MILRNRVSVLSLVALAILVPMPAYANGSLVGWLVIFLAFIAVLGPVVGTVLGLIGAFARTPGYWVTLLSMFVLHGYLLVRGDSGDRALNLILVMAMAASGWYFHKLAYRYLRAWLDSRNDGAA